MALPRRITKAIVQDKAGVTRQYVHTIIKRIEAGGFVPTTESQKKILRQYKHMKKLQKNSANE